MKSENKIKAYISILLSICNIQVGLYKVLFVKYVFRGRERIVDVNEYFQVLMAFFMKQNVPKTRGFKD